MVLLRTKQIIFTLIVLGLLLLEALAVTLAYNEWTDLRPFYHWVLLLLFFFAVHGIFLWYTHVYHKETPYLHFFYQPLLFLVFAFFFITTPHEKMITAVVNKEQGISAGMQAFIWEKAFWSEAAAAEKIEQHFLQAEYSEHNESSGNVSLYVYSVSETVVKIQQALPSMNGKIVGDVAYTDNNQQANFLVTLPSKDSAALSELLSAQATNHIVYGVKTIMQMFEDEPLPEILQVQITLIDVKLLSE